MTQLPPNMQPEIHNTVLCISDATHMGCNQVTTKPIERAQTLIIWQKINLLTDEIMSLMLNIIWEAERKLNLCGMQIKWNESGFRPLLCTYRLNWARRTSWGWWDEWDETALKTQDSKLKPWRSEAKHVTSRSRGSPQYWVSRVDREETFFQTAETGKRTPNPWKATVLTTTPRPCVMPFCLGNAVPRNTLCEHVLTLSTRLSKYVYDYPQ